MAVGGTNGPAASPQAPSQRGARKIRPAIPFAGRENRPRKVWKTRANISEGALHKQVAAFLNKFLEPPAVWSTFPAGWGKIPPMTYRRLQAAGLKPGMPDIFIWWYDEFHPGCCRCIGIELKARYRKPSEAQADMFDRLHKAGVKVYTCWDLNDVTEALRSEGIPNSMPRSIA